MKLNDKEGAELSPKVEPEALEVNLQFSETAMHKELDLIQAIITRMAQNSFQIKTWYLGGISALAAFGNGMIPNLVLSSILLVVVLTFWYLDAYYHHLERRYRGLYRWVVENRHKTNDYLFDLWTFDRKNNGVKGNNLNLQTSVYKLMLSKSIVLFYAPIFIIVLNLVGYNAFKLFAC